jgi:hypothetical protein
MYLRTRYANASSASAASASPRARRSITARTSLSPHRPSKPLFLLSNMSICSAVRLSVRIKCSGTAGSTSPQRVPMTSPSSGVSPIDVSTDAPRSTAVTLLPLPRWHVIALRAPGAIPSIAAAVSARYLWLRGGRKEGV